MSLIRQVSLLKEIVRERRTATSKDIETQRGFNNIYDEINKFKLQLENVPDIAVERQDDEGSLGGSRVVYDETLNSYIPEFKTPEGWSTGRIMGITDQIGGLTTPADVSSPLPTVPDCVITDKSATDADYVEALSINVGNMSSVTVDGVLANINLTTLPSLEGTVEDFGECDSNFSSIVGSLIQTDANFTAVEKNFYQMGKMLEAVAKQVEDLRYVTYSMQHAVTGTAPANVSSGTGYGYDVTESSAGTDDGANIKASLDALKTYVTELNTDLNTVKNNQRSLINYLDDTKIEYKLSETAVSSD